MADPLSITASTIAVVGLGWKIVDTCCKIRNAPKEAIEVSEELSSLLPLLTRLRAISEEIDRERSDGAALHGLRELLDENGPLHICRSRLEGLEQQMQSIFGQAPAGAANQAPPEVSRGTRMKAALNRVKWPFQESETKKVLESIRSLRDNVQLCLQVHQIGALDTISDKVDDFRGDLAEIMRCTVNQQIRQWLDPSDPSANYYAALAERHSGTGLWLTENSADFARWKNEAKYHLWLHGIPGCGKSVLSASIIEQTGVFCARSNKQSALAYFYFDFKDSMKQNVEQLLRSIIFQLANQSCKTKTALDELYHDSGMQSTYIPHTRLVITLRKLLDDFRDEYIVIDALDECTEQEKLLEVLQQITTWSSCNLHIALLSRESSVIREEPRAKSYNAVALTPEVIDNDIAQYVEAQLNNKPKLQKLVHNNPQNRHMILTRLAHGAKGMFRWVECQLTAISSCIRPSDLKRTLDDLPRTLDDTYARILESLKQEVFDDVVKILQWLCYAQRPMRVMEIAEALALDVNQAIPSIDKQRRLFDPFEVVSMCADLVSVTTLPSLDASRYSEADRTVLQLAHFSVKEYLILRRSSSKEFDATSSHKMMAASCLGYLLATLPSENTDGQYTEEYDKTIRYLDILARRHGRRVGTGLVPPLAFYALQSWLYHYESTTLEDIAFLTDAVHRLLSHAWYRQRMGVICRQHNERNVHHVHYQKFPVSTPLFTSAELGLVNVCRKILREESSPDHEELRKCLQTAVDHSRPQVIQVFIDFRNSLRDDALLSACKQGRIDFVSLLLDKGSNANYRTDNGHKWQRTPLVCAVRYRKVPIINLLLDRGADLNSLDGEFSPLEHALNAAISHPRVTICFEIVELLLHRGAVVDMRFPGYASALQAACKTLNLPMVKLLVNNGADVNATLENGENALQIATEQEHIPMVAFLLDNGADKSASKWPPMSALQAAAGSGNVDFVLFLLAHGADIDAQGGHYGSALQAASQGCEWSMVTLLLDLGADVNAQGGHNRTALQAASGHGQEAIVKRLLYHGADINALGEYYGTALQAASENGHEAIIKLLLAHGADVNAPGGYGGTALQAVSRNGQEAIVKLLLRHGADVNAPGKWTGAALQAASENGHKAIVELLLALGADVNALEGYNGTALQAASRNGQEAIVKLLLCYGADVNVPGKWTGAALQAASENGRKAIVELLLALGANVNAHGGPCGSALHTACYMGHIDTVRILILRHADVNLQAESRFVHEPSVTESQHFWTPLDAARASSSDAQMSGAIESLLRKHGAYTFKELAQSPQDDEEHVMPKARTISLPIGTAADGRRIRKTLSAAELLRR